MGSNSNMVRSIVEVLISSMAPIIIMPDHLSNTTNHNPTSPNIAVNNNTNQWTNTQVTIIPQPHPTIQVKMMINISLEKIHANLRFSLLYNPDQHQTSKITKLRDEMIICNINKFYQNNFK